MVRLRCIKDYDTFPRDRLKVLTYSKGHRQYVWRLSNILSIKHTHWRIAVINILDRFDTSMSANAGRRNHGSYLRRRIC